MTSLDDGVYNAQIISTMLGIEPDHDVLTALVFVEYELGSQGFGGFNLTKSMPMFVEGVLRAVGKDHWEQLQGTYCRIGVSDGLIERIGHIVKDKWFDRKSLHD